MAVKFVGKRTFKKGKIGGRATLLSTDTLIEAEQELGRFRRIFPDSTFAIKRSRSKFLIQGEV